MADIKIEEMEWHLKQNTATIQHELAAITANALHLQQRLTDNDWANSDVHTWIDGYMTRDVTHLSSLLMRQQTLYEALNIMKKGGE